MSNVIGFPATGTDGAPECIDVGSNAAVARSHVQQFLAEPPAHSHVVQFYEGEAFLLDTVAQFLGAGLEAGDRLVVIATPQHREGLMQRLETLGGKEAVARGQLKLLDACETLAKFMVNGMPDRDLFRNAIGGVMSRPRGDDQRPARIRAFGEMVDVLWRDGNSRAAIRLEELWNDAGTEHSFSLLCAYVMGNFYKEGDQAKFLEVCRTHSRVLPTEEFSQLDDADERLREIILLQQRARSLESEILHRKELEAALRDALKDRHRVEDELRASLQREKDARERAEANEAFKEMFLGILGHDLRNPLSSVLTTARTMTMRGDLSADSNSRLGRVVSSGMRMQRMIDQLLDLTRARLADGIPVNRTQQDLAPLVAKIVEEIRLANPSRTIQLEIQGSCIASVDADRFEQVVSNLIANAVAHGEPTLPIRVDLIERGAVASLNVLNWGTPISATLLPLLFDPFRRAKEPRGRADGLGLGLYIAERIIRAHGGRIEVASSAEAGTRFEVIVPCHA
jgi:signal transduction histidine kinase